MSRSQITNRIRELRFFSDEMTQKELAEKVGVTRQTIVAMEKQRYSPSLELAFRLSRIFGKRVEEVFFYDAEETG
ncbi:MAG: helix-turn-helix transcriptional regulator [Spirochaetales bacterium]|nr:helix-turn-helix transcriptional regulator [Spirochaetales bacterium]